MVIDGDHIITGWTESELASPTVPDGSNLQLLSITVMSALTPKQELLHMLEAGVNASSRAGWGRGHCGKRRYLLLASRNNHLTPVEAVTVDRVDVRVRLCWLRGLQETHHDDDDHAASQSSVEPLIFRKIRLLRSGHRVPHGHRCHGGELWTRSLLPKM